MGSLNKNSSNAKLKSSEMLGHDFDQVLAWEQAERKLAAAKIRCEFDIAAWLENVTFQLTETGKELVKEVEVTANQLLMQARENGMNSKELFQDMDIKFVPRILQKSEFGFLCHGNLLPSSVCLELITRLPDISVGVTVAFSIEAGGLISPFVKNNLDFSVHNDSADSVPCQEVSGSSGGNCLMFSFHIPSAGHFTVKATLYNQHIVGSPVVIPVFTSAVTGLAQLGLAALGQITKQEKTVTAPAVQQEFDSTTVSPELARTRPDRLMFKTGQVKAAPLATKMHVLRQPIGPGSLPGKGFVRSKTSLPEEVAEKQKKLVMGDVCFAKWDHDGVWYNAKIDKDCRERGVEVTFVDYDNSDFVQRKNIVWNKEELPEGAMVDFGPDGDMIVVGDLAVAQWEEDGVWYNARVLGFEEGRYSVLFTDYDNIAFCEPSQIFKDVADIPVGEILDIHVDMILEPEEQVTVKEEISVQVRDELLYENLGTKWFVGNDCLARWVQDGVWYNAIVDAVFESAPPVHYQYLVTFTDYGNSELVTDNDLAANVEAIPGDQLNMLDENILKSQTFAQEEMPAVLQSEPKQIRNPLVRKNLDHSPSPVPKCEKFTKGLKVIAKREEHQTWHRAVIHEVVAPGRLYIVRYEDIGQYGGAGPNNIVMDKEDIPKGEKVGHDVAGSVQITNENTQQVWSVGDSCIARWSQDNVWYNAKVLSVGFGRTYLVKFVDYGNEDNVMEQDMVKTVMEISEDSFVYENVDQNPEEGPPQVHSEIVVPKSYTEPPAPAEPLSKPAPKVPRPLKPESFDQARLLADAASFIVGASKEASLALLRTEVSRPGVEPVVSQTPLSLQCCLCKNICRKGMRLVCDSSPVCWGCAVKEITRGHVCWHCGEKNISSDSHLVRDQVLRSFVEQFVTTGKLDPAHEKDIRNGLIKPECKVEVKSEPIATEQLLISENDKLVRVLPDDACLAMFSEDGVWYNGLVSEVYGDGSALVYFIDYGNSERVQQPHIARGPEDLPRGAEVDCNVQKITVRNIVPPSQVLRQPNNSEKLNFLSLASLSADGVATMAAKETLIIKDLKGPIGVTVLADGSLAVVCRGANCVSRYNMEGAFLGIIKPGREFVKPSDILTLANGEFVVRDDRGIQLFGVNLEFVKFLAEEVIDRCFGLAEDDEGRIITINCNTAESRVKITMLNKTDLFFIDRISNKVVKRVEMVDLIEEAVEELQSLQADMSACRFLSYHNQKLYVVDLGLDCVFVLYKNETESELFGGRGNKGGEFRDPAGLVVDDTGTMMVVDSRNHRLQLINKDLKFSGLVKVDTPLARPSGIFLDRLNRDIIVSNYLSKSVVRYKMVYIM